MSTPNPPQWCEFIANLQFMDVPKQEQVVIRVKKVKVFLYRPHTAERYEQPVHTVKTGVSFRHLLRHRNSASASVVSTLKVSI
jgi:hypothetical protein